jgi:hypothetical protein
VRALRQLLHRATDTVRVSDDEIEAIAWKDGASLRRGRC